MSKTLQRFRQASEVPWAPETPESVLWAVLPVLPCALRHGLNATLDLNRFGRSLPACLHRIEELDCWGVRFLATTQPIDTDQHNPASRLLLHVLGAAAEFERSLILERTQAGQVRYRDAYEKGHVGKTVHSRSGKDLPPHRPRRIFDRDRVVELRRQRLSLRQIAREMGLGLGTVTRTLQGCSKSR